MRLPQLFLNNEATSIRLPQLASLQSLLTVEALHLALQLLVPQSPRLVPQVCLICFSQLETLLLNIPPFVHPNIA